METSKGKYVITGSASLTGSHLAGQLVQRGARDVVLIYDDALGSPENHSNV